MDYTPHEMLAELGILVNKAQQMRNTIAAAMKTGDARHVCLSGIQTSVEPVMMLFGLLEVANRYIQDIELSKVSGLKNRSNDEILANLDTWSKLNFLVFSHFRIESLFLNLLSAIDPSQSGIRGFEKITTNLFAKLTMNDKQGKLDAIRVLSTLRNSLHNNSVNKNPTIDITVNGKRFELIQGQNTHASIFDIVFLVSYSLDMINDIINTPEVLALTVPIPDQFHLNLGTI